MDSKSFKAVHEFFRKLNIESDIINAVKLQFKFINLKPQSVLLRQGEQQKYGYFILSGILRSCHYSDIGREHCKEYYFIGELCFLYSTWLTNTPAKYQIDALNNAEVIRVPLHLLNLQEWQPAKLELLQQQLLYKEDKEIFSQFFVNEN